ncbi:hypothetical protein [Shewanella aestuarii]|uniref:Uncharacterized protein n=1 Tax=Shewanella aestuarii TaxID=1028752 RepID=A0A6G9QSD2_9GAMM|nr:hypothetical protein [Shewanella aestuarii]QIR16681.1 hypothetical protein HBH39_19605 [Shewanella aestuarii]
MKIKVTLLSCLFSIISLNGFAADSCSQSPRESHQDKFERYMIDEVPSLLESCGLGDLVIDMPSMPSFGADLFCGFGTNDLMGFYGEYSGNSFPGGSGGSKYGGSSGGSSGGKSSTPKPSPKPPMITPPITKPPIVRPPIEPGGRIQSKPKEDKWVPADLFKDN